GVVDLIAGDAHSATIEGNAVAVEIGNTTELFDRVVVATGFNPLSFERLLPKNTLPIRRRGRQTKIMRMVSDLIAEDLSVEGLSPKLHLPMLAGFRQGPGLPNLTCLGLMADRILKSYVEPSSHA